MHPDPLRLQRMLTLGAGLAAALVAGQGGCGDARGCRDRADISALIPADATAALILPAPAVVTGPASAFLQGLGDRGGIFTWIAANYGVDLSSREGIAGSGVDPDAPTAVFATAGGLFAVAGAGSRRRLDDLVDRRLRVAGFEGAVERRVSGATVRVAEGDGDAPRTVAWTYARGAIVLGAGDGDEVVAAVAGIAGRSRDAPALQGAERYRGAVGPLGPPRSPASAVAYIDLPASGWVGGAERALSGLGFAGTLASGLVRDAGAVAARFELRDDGVAVDARVELPSDEVDALRAWLDPARASIDAGAWLPRDTTAVARVHLRGDAARSMPSFLLQRLVPEGALARLHPLLAEVSLAEDLIAHLEGDVVVAWLGLAPGQAPARLLSAADLAHALPAVEAAILLDVREPEAFARRWARLRPAAERAGYAVSALEPLPGGSAGVRLTSRATGEYIAAFIVGHEVVVAIGAGAAVAIREVREDRAASLGERIESPALKALARGESGVAGLVGAMSRIARELSQRGAPPTFLRVLDAVFEWGAVLDIGDDGLALRVEVNQ